MGRHEEEYAIPVNSFLFLLTKFGADPKRDLFAFLLGQLGGILALLLIPKPLLPIFHWSIIAFLFPVATWGGIAWFVADLVFPDSPVV
jgi:uncharacterized membrane protein YdbT with pleckstrin-like domain